MISLTLYLLGMKLCQALKTNEGVSSFNWFCLKREDVCLAVLLNTVKAKFNICQDLCLVGCDALSLGKYF
jgi:hypothetical protein